MRQAHLLISGFVQGVGFRAFVRNNAEKLGLTGWVRNLADKRIEIIAQGDDKMLQEFIKICSRGPFLSEVKSVAVEWEESLKTYSKFEAHPTA